MTQQTSNITINPPGSSQQGGSITTMQTTPAHAGATGDMQFSIPLPANKGRGFVPGLTLQYQTSQGNSTFGVGWQLPLLCIRLYTKHGVPAYDGQDKYIGPQGEVLEPERHASGEIVVTTVSRFSDKTIAAHDVVRYQSRVSRGYERCERWQLSTDLTQTFWLVFANDGSLHCLGKTALAQTSDRGRIAQWSIEESLSPQGEHIRYVYKAENDDHIDTTLAPENARLRGALSYLTHVFYANVDPEPHLYAWQGNWPDDLTGWLFSVIVDYGERSLDTTVPPSWAPVSAWSARQDAFSDYRYGFEVRCHRLCRQVLLFHHFPDELGTPTTLARRLLFCYHENPILTQCTGVQEWAYDANNTAESRPVLNLSYQPFDSPDATNWRKLPPTPGIDDAPGYQLVDLYGEGLPGVLYRQGKDWRYRAPIRGSNSEDIDYSGWKPVPQVPSLQDGTQMLADLTGDGRLDWAVTQAGLQGFFTLGADQTWQTFTPFTAVPAELLSGKGVFADIMGAGLSDVAVIGPKSIRFYPNTRSGFAPGETGEADETSDNSKLAYQLPIQGRNKRTLVAFSDLLGSGQSHLVEVNAQYLYCWPNKGRGHFGEKVSLAWAWEGVEDFNPQRLYLVDIDGSGASDLVYAHSDKLTLFYNHSGNGFAAGVDMPLPAGVQFDDTCQLSFADIQGSGGMSVLLSIPHMTPAHWVLALTPHKPYLMNKIDNQCGAVSEVVYRHSGQEWLDEKASSPKRQCHLPMPLYIVKTITNSDVITGNQLTQRFLYRQGVYDGVEREFRGFGYVETLDTQMPDDATSDTDSPPLKTCQWYHLGLALPAAVPYWQGDALAYSLGEPCFSQWQNGNDVPYLPSGSDQWWALRALTGVLLREEIYGLDSALDDSANDGSGKDANPYSVQSQRYLIRQRQLGIDKVAAPVFMVLGLEQLVYHYERLNTDPRCQQTITLSYDEYGQPTYQIGIDYPRRRTSTDELMAVSPYASTDTQDEQQFTLRLNETLSAYLNEETTVYTTVGLPSASRQNVINAAESAVPADGFSFESLPSSDLIGLTATRHFVGQQQTFYINAGETSGFTYPPRTEHVETAVLDDVALKAYDDVIATPQALADELTQAGYIQVPRVLSMSVASGTESEIEREIESAIWAAPQSFARYDDANGFYLPIATQSTRLVGETLLTYDAYHLLVTTVEDAAGNQTTMAIDYQQLSPHSIIDINNNTRQTSVTPLGYPVSASFYGEQAGVMSGFTPLTDSTVPPLVVTELIAQAGQSIQSTAVLSALDEFSWQAATPLPLHQITVVADQYPDADTQLQQVKVAYSDGFGRALQVTQKVAPGLAYQRDSAGELVLDDNGVPVEVSSSQRWAVSGRVEYNNKGQVVRQYPPYFVDDWQYVADTALRAQVYANTHYYDALGREIVVVTAKGYRRRTQYTPWFTVVEDENDTWHEITSPSPP